MEYTEFPVSKMISTMLRSHSGVNEDYNKNNKVKCYPVFIKSEHINLEVIE